MRHFLLLLAGLFAFSVVPAKATEINLATQVKGGLFNNLFCYTQGTIDPDIGVGFLCGISTPTTYNLPGSNPGVLMNFMVGTPSVPLPGTRQQYATQCTVNSLGSDKGFCHVVETYGDVDGITVTGHGGGGQLINSNIVGLLDQNAIITEGAPGASIVEGESLIHVRQWSLATSGLSSKAAFLGIGMLIEDNTVGSYPFVGGAYTTANPPSGTAYPGLKIRKIGSGQNLWLEAAATNAELMLCTDAAVVDRCNLQLFGGSTVFDIHGSTSHAYFQARSPAGTEAAMKFFDDATYRYSVGKNTSGDFGLFDHQNSLGILYYNFAGNDVTLGNTSGSVALEGLARFTTGVYTAGTGVKHIHGGATGCITGASSGAGCDTTVAFDGTVFSSTNYTAVCNGDGITSGVPVDGGIVSKATGSVVFRTVAITAVAAQFTTVDCIAFHN